jgi:hypothetical protein
MPRSIVHVEPDLRSFMEHSLVLIGGISRNHRQADFAIKSKESQPAAPEYGRGQGHYNRAQVQFNNKSRALGVWTAIRVRLG